MTEIADIGFRVNTADLEKGTTGLNKLAAAAVGVDSANMKMAKLAEAAGISVARAAKIAADAEYKKAQALRANLIASGNASREELKAARNAELAANAKLKQAREVEANTKRLNAESEALRRNNALQVASTRPTNRISAIASQGTLAAAPIARDMMPNRFNTANIAAQFQDIGVTATMGMNPMIIALQQGTQLSAIMNSMESPLKGIALALRSVFNVTSLLSIGFVGVIAALIQFVDWTKVGKAVLNGLADAIEFATPYILGLATALTLLYSRTIIAGIATLATTIFNLGVTALVAGGKMAMAWVIGMGPVGWVIAGVVAVGAAFQALGVDIVGYIKSAMNTVVGIFAFALNKISELVNKTLDKISEYKKIVSMIPGVGNALGVAGEAAGNSRLGNVVQPGTEFTTDYIGDVGDFADNAASSFAKKLRKYAAGMGQGDGKGAKSKKDPWEELVGDAQRKITVLKAEQAAIGMTEQAAAKLRYETELLNEAQQKGIILDQEKRTKIEELASGMANAEIETKRLKEAYDFLRDASKSFVSDLRSSLNEGKSLWESFGNAVKNVIDKMLDKIIGSQIESIIGSLVPSGGGGLLSSFASILSGGIGSGGGIDSAIASSIANNPSIYAKGGAFNNGLIPFANGGAFTNSIVNSATPFAFAGGGAFGVMGEAGPEAVMPLHRGPDGSLGVRTSGGAANDNGASQQNVTYVINAPGASKADLESVKQTIVALAGPGRIEERVAIAQARNVL